MTDVTTTGPTLTGKGLETLLRTDPAIQRVLFVHSPNPIWVPILPGLWDVAASHGTELIVREVANVDEAARTFDRVQFEEVDAILLPVDQTALEARSAVRALSLRAGIPVFTLTSNPVGGATMSYAADASDFAMQLAVLADTVLSGTPAGDLPVEIPRRVVLRLYADNARDVGYAFTPEALAAADEVLGELSSAAP